MKPYVVTYEFYYNEKLKGSRSITKLLATPSNEEISGSDFNSLWDLYEKYNLLLPFSAWNFKKGRLLSFYDSLRDIKEWKNNCKPWKFVINSEETTISMNRLMQFNSEDVIQYLKERGITTCPMNF